MIVVAIIGVLSALALPALTAYIRRSKTAEAGLNLRRMFDASVTYYQEDRVARTGDVMPPRFPAAIGQTPGDPSVLMCSGGASVAFRPLADTWSDETWMALNFAISDPHRFSYQFESEGIGADASFTARASADLDCDGTGSLFERAGGVEPDRGVTGGAGMYVFRALE